MHLIPVRCNIVIPYTNGCSTWQPFPCRLHCGQQEGDQHADDGDDHQELDQRKAIPAGTVTDGTWHDTSLDMGPSATQPTLARTVRDQCSARVSRPRRPPDRRSGRKPGVETCRPSGKVGRPCHNQVLPVSSKDGTENPTDFVGWVSATHRSCSRVVGCAALIHPATTRLPALACSWRPGAA